MSLKNFFTEYDDTIEANAYRDPMGLQIIWSAVGQNIFGRNITSISSDMRNFNINLFNHWIVKDLTSGAESLQLSSKQKNFYSHAGLKISLIIFLENLLTYILVTENNVDQTGLLGAQKAKNRLEKDALDDISISVDVNDEVLLRQISLGVNGRYRTPFIEAGLMDTSYNYEPYPDAWKEATILFGSPSFNRLSKYLKLLIQQLFNNQQEQIPPSILIRDIPELESIKRGYTRCFGSRENMRSGEFQTFWRNRLELNHGAAGALYDYASKRIGNDELSVSDVVHGALENTSVGSEDWERIEDIKRLEPFLVSMNYLFQLICAQEVETIDQLQETLVSKEQADFLLSLMQKTSTAEQVIAKISGYSKMRLQQLTRISLESLQDCVQGIQKYQNAVMEQRGNNAWFTFDGSRIKHNVREFSTKTIRYRPWENGYYIDSMISLCRGLEEDAVETA